MVREVTPLGQLNKSGRIHLSSTKRTHYDSLEYDSDENDESDHGNKSNRNKWTSKTYVIIIREYKISPYRYVIKAINIFLVAA